MSPNPGFNVIYVFYAIRLGLHRGAVIPQAERAGRRFPLKNFIRYVVDTNVAHIVPCILPDAVLPGFVARVVIVLNVSNPHGEPYPRLHFAMVAEFDPLG